MVTPTNKNNRILIVAYYWPPSGGGGVQRWVKFSKYLAQLGWDITVAVPDTNDYPVIDDSMQRDIPDSIQVLKTPIWEPYSLFKLFTGKKRNKKIYSAVISDKNTGWKQRFSLWVRANLFIPDARSFWIRPASKAILKYLQKNPVDLLISTGPPHSTHLIAKRVKKKTNIPWVADFRDPWTYNDLVDHFPMLSWVKRRHAQLEKSVLEKADKVVTVSWDWAEDFKKISNKDIEVITNGFDHEDFQGEVDQVDQKFTIVHIGSINSDRNCDAFWKAVHDLCQNNNLGFKEQLQIELIGPVDYSVQRSIEKYSLSDVVQLNGFLSHDKAIDRMKKAQVLLLLTNNTANVKGVLPGKLYEYIGANRPILGIGIPDSDCAKILGETNTGKIASFEEVHSIAAIIKDYFKLFQSNQLSVASKNKLDFSRKNLAKKYDQLLRSILAG